LCENKKGVKAMLTADDLSAADAVAIVSNAEGRTLTEKEINSDWVFAPSIRIRLAKANFETFKIIESIKGSY
jgi:hypothetical protein